MSQFDTITKEGRLLYRYIRGSHLYNLNTSTSDLDEGGVFMCTRDEFFGLHQTPSQVSDERHDTTWFEIGELVRLLLKSNPTVMEALWVPNNKIIGNVHPFMQTLIDNREAFISKDCFNPFFGYAKAQIAKARGLEKKINLPIVERKTPYDYIYTFKGQGSTKLKDWLNNRGLFQGFCGLVNIPNMHDVYGLYYDFGAHFQTLLKDVPYELIWVEHTFFMDTAIKYFNLKYDNSAIDFLASLKPIGYRGVVNEDGKSDPRLSSIDDKDTKPLCFISYNQSGYQSHCKQYKEYKEWEKMRNPVRYESNLEKNYDSKNMMHCFRLIHMAKEIAEGKGLILERDKDREFLLDIKAHKFEYDELYNMLLKEMDEMNEAMANSTIREHVDFDFANSLLLDIRKKQFGV